MIIGKSWRKSSYSAGAQSSCVEVAPTRAGVVVRDSKNPDGPVIDYPATHWRAFLRSRT
ncbi:DUF397 domain-containing protein [Actinosynnema sp. CS-041913]|uniref:DUF397 domain-containing protein n=1 Tax=Actinosynnema sp. CS-041913 TaxID=3239917 RepID=UPI003D9299E5